MSAKVCPLAEIIRLKNVHTGSANPPSRLGDHECTVAICKFKEGGRLCRINATYNLQRKIAEKLGIRID